jgi:hypothetical protein
MRRGLFPCVLSTVVEAQGFQRKIGAANGGDIKSNRIRAAKVLACENSRSISLGRSKAIKKVETCGTNCLFDGINETTPETGESSLLLNSGDLAQDAMARRRSGDARLKISGRSSKMDAIREDWRKRALK